MQNEQSTISKSKIDYKTLVLIAIFIAVGVAVPTIFHYFFGDNARMVSPIHTVVIIAGLYIGKRAGLIVGAVVPLLCSLVTGMPVLFPVATIMIFECAAYGFFSGYIAGFIKTKYTYLNLVLAVCASLLAGRIVAGVFAFAIHEIFVDGYTFSGYLSSYFVKAVRAIIFQILVCPPVALSLKSIAQNKSGN